MKQQRRALLTALPLMGTTLLASAAPVAPAAPRKSERFPGDPPEHKLVYQLNHADADYIEHILNSVGAMISKYEDNISITVVTFGPGVHLLAKKPKRPIPEGLRTRSRTQATNYGVKFIVCGNTMKSLDWTAQDIVPYASIEEIGAATLMELQEQGYSYIAW